MSTPTDVREWKIEDESFWKNTGSAIAYKNLKISIPGLLCGFAVWVYWSIITVQMMNVGFPFTDAELFTIVSIAGLSGATLRIPSTFFIRPCGGRNTIFFTTALLLIPAIGVGFALKSKDTPLWVFQILAVFSGFGGGNFASSMSNISFFFPKKIQGTALGLNAGLGNFGVTTTQLLIPLVMTMGIFGGEAMTLVRPSGSLLGKIPAGELSYIFNAGFIWAPILTVIVVLAFFKMNNIVTENVTPNYGSFPLAISKISWLLFIGLMTAVIGSYAMIYLKISKWIVLPTIIFVTVFLLKLLSPGELKGALDRQYKIFGLKHNWIMTIIYTMTFGSFIGFSQAFPLSINVIFGFKHIMNSDGVWTHTTANPLAPSALSYAWIAPFIGALIRPIGGWISDKFGGALVTQICSLFMIIGTALAGYYMKSAYQSESPEIFFMPFFFSFLLIFLASGVGNGSTFRTIAVIFSDEHRGPVLGWTSAVAAYGSFIIPIIFGEQIKNATPENALIGFGIFYFVCAVVNWWYYLGPKADHKNP